ncbi:hypothetical protein [Pararhizobium sp. IMCC21322]|uniref:hypothetical protein n=1 Tax=Pararhizobium sp. IMCC21322 TaxID=3067903 RepID=UPI0027417B66|nr:hypothetical protein [Pararhizobium sp. IMCC21322]
MRFTALLCASALFISGMNHSYAGPLENARQAYLDSEATLKKLETTSAAKLAEKRNAHDALTAKVNQRQNLIAKVAKQRDTLLQRKVALELELAKRAEGIRLLNRVWRDMLANPLASSAAQKREIRNDLAEENRQTAAARTTIDSLNKQILVRAEALQKASIDSDFIGERGLLEQQFIAMEDHHRKQEIELKAGQDRSRQAFARFVSLAGQSAPALVERVRISGSDGVLYEAEWRSETASREPDDRMCGFPEQEKTESESTETLPTQDGALALEVELRGLLKGAESQQKTLEAVIDQMDGRADEYVVELKKLGDDYALQYLKISELKNTELAINTVVDMGVVVAELLLTGGAATVARKGVEIGADQLGKLVAKRLSTNVRRKISGKIFDEGEAVARRQFITAYSAQVRDALAHVTKRGSDMPLDQMRAQAGRLFDDVAEKAFKDYFNDRLGANAGVILNRRLMNANAQTVVNVVAGNPSTPEGRALRSVASDLSEVGFDKLLGAAAYGGYEKLAASGKDWKRVSAALASIKPDSLSELIPKKPADIVGFVGAATKAAFAYGIGVKIQTETKKAVQLMNQDVSLRAVYERLYLDREVVKIKVRDVAVLVKGLELRLQALLTGRHLNRRLTVLSDNVIDEPEANHTFLVVFSKPLTRPPVVKIAGATIVFDAQAGPAGLLEWTGTLPVKDIGGAFETAMIEISAIDMAGQQLDASPASIAVPKLASEGFLFFDPGTDRCYEILLDLAMTIEASFEGVLAKQRIK